MFLRKLLTTLAKMALPGVAIARTFSAAGRNSLAPRARHPAPMPGMLLQRAGHPAAIAVSWPQTRRRLCR